VVYINDWLDLYHRIQYAKYYIIPTQYSLKFGK
jgi:hypothetical protein